MNSTIFFSLACLLLLSLLLSDIFIPVQVNAVTDLVFVSAPAEPLPMFPKVIETSELPSSSFVDFILSLPLQVSHLYEAVLLKVVALKSYSVASLAQIPQLAKFLLSEASKSQLPDFNRIMLASIATALLLAFALIPRTRLASKQIKKAAVLSVLPEASQLELKPILPSSPMVESSMEVEFNPIQLQESPLKDDVIKKVANSKALLNPTRKPDAQANLKPRGQSKNQGIYSFLAIDPNHEVFSSKYSLANHHPAPVSACFNFRDLNWNDSTLTESSRLMKACGGSATVDANSNGVGDDYCEGAVATVDAHLVEPPDDGSKKNSDELDAHFTQPQDDSKKNSDELNQNINANMLGVRLALEEMEPLLYRRKHSLDEADFWDDLPEDDYIETHQIIEANPQGNEKMIGFYQNADSMPICETWENRLDPSHFNVPRYLKFNSSKSANWPVCLKNNQEFYHLQLVIKLLEVRAKLPPVVGPKFYLADEGKPFRSRQGSLKNNY